MSATAHPRPSPSASPTGAASIARVAALAAVLLAAIAFVLLYVFRYYLNYNEAAFDDPVRGAPNYWRDRIWLLFHISGGSLAILSGPWQFWTGLRARHLRFHRWTGRLFLLGVAVGSVGAVRLALDTSFGWAYGVALCSLAFAWLITTGTALYAIRSHQIEAHREWMTRAYVVTFAFVTSASSRTTRLWLGWSRPTSST